MSESVENPLPEDLPAPPPAGPALPHAGDVPAAAPDTAVADEVTVTPPAAGEGDATHTEAAQAEAVPAPLEEAPAGPAEPAEPATAAAPAVPALPAVPDLSPAACAALLAEHFPALFNAGRALPLKLRIQADIQQRAPGLFSKKSLSIFLHRHTTSTAYLRALVNLPQRYDLDGVAAGDVAEEHRLAATAEVERRRGIVEARRQAERDAEREARRQAHRPAPSAPAAASAEGEAPAAPPAQTDENRRPPRPRREGPGPQGDRPPRPPRPAHEGAGPRPAGDRPPRPPRPPRPMQPPQQHAAQQAVDGAAPEQMATPADAPAVATPVAAAPAPARPTAPQLSPAELEARRDRATLLRSYEASTITRANFCVLKRISESELEAQLKVARQERELRPPAPRHDARQDGRNDGRPDNRGEQRGEQRFDRGGPRRDDRGPRPDHRGPPRGAGPAHGKPPGKPSR